MRSALVVMSCARFFLETLLEQQGPFDVGFKPPQETLVGVMSSNESCGLSSL